MSPPAAARPPLFARRYDRRGRRKAGPPVWDPRAWKLVVSPAGVPGFVLLAVSAAALFVQARTGGPAPWVLSLEALAQGRVYTLATQMIAHAGVGHLLMNASVLLPLAALVMVRMGPGPDGWRRFVALYVGAGLAGAALYLALNPHGLPMVGASGAIFGLWGAVSRIRADGGMAPLRSQQVWDEVFLVAVLNALMYLIVFVLVRLEGGVLGGLAWEGHVGGFLFGLLAMPWLAPRTPPPATC